MNTGTHFTKGIFTLFIIWTFLSGSLIVKSQNLLQSSGLIGGSSVFVARKTSPVQRNYARSSSNRSSSRSSKASRTVARRKITKQYNTLARVTKRKKEIKVYTPAEFVKLKRETPQQASDALTGGAQYYLENDKLENSLGMFKEAVGLDGKNANAKFGYSEALRQQADNYLEEENLLGAKGFYLEAIKFNAENSAAYAGLGAAYDEEENNEEAIANYEKALKIDADLTEVYAPLGILYLEESEKAEDEGKLIAKASEYLTKALAAEPNNAETQYFLGFVRFKQKKFQEATTVLNKSLEIESNNAQAHFYLGEISAQAENFDKAIVEYEKAIQLKPDYVDAWFNLGVADFALKKYPEAIRAYTEITQKLENSNGLAHANLAETYKDAALNATGDEKKKYYELAEGSYRLATAFIKDDVNLYSNLGLVSGVLGKWKGTINALESAIKIKPDAIDYTNLGWAYYNYAKQDLKASKKEQAREKLLTGKTALENAVKLDPTSPGAYLNLGITLTDLEQHEAAAQTLEKATSLKSNWLDATNELGVAYRNLNRYQKAAEQFRKAVEIDSKFIVGYYNWGESEAKQKNFKQAEKIAEQLRPLSKYYAIGLKNIIAQEKRKK